ncbi:nitrilase-related carbon-nitrogen hydrolase [Marinifilum sp.]|uniref:nitrilase-related carbon-nitrogen hydrolase n=1 Tax=Marinifilum sp. TaxID=2033137 RepID=UPI003BA8D187
MRVAAVSSKSIIGNVQENLSVTIKWIKELNKKGAEFILFPEMNLSGYSKNKTVVDKVLLQKELLFSKLLEISNQVKLAFAFGFPEEEKGKYFISQFILSNGKIIGKHRKTHLSPSEKELYSEGDEIEVFLIRKLSLGIQLCYETHFPEISAIQAQKGANVMAMAFASPKETCRAKIDRFKRYIPARAYDNSCFAMTCNQVTENERGTVFPCASLIVDPKGNVLSESFVEENEFALADINLDGIERIKQSKMACFNAHKRTDWLREYYE